MDRLREKRRSDTTDQGTKAMVASIDFTTQGCQTNGTLTTSHERRSIQHAPALRQEEKGGSTESHNVYGKGTLVQEWVRCTIEYNMANPVQWSAVSCLRFMSHWHGSSCCRLRNTTVTLLQPPPPRIFAVPVKCGSRYSRESHKTNGEFQKTSYPSVMVLATKLKPRE
ncbi:unnamed protein product [Phytophthora lilii]|uniref:Unnamed protein product n=1 Tax=Phytophthora lilii TaxID=2077276 RepID=A0A9W7CQ54_9STRA|nr:unnamed protein product [Phytophthora lilii]